MKNISLSYSHTFAIPAYKESPYLEECVLSLKKQTVKSHILIFTSTPSEFIENISRQYNVPLVVNNIEPCIALDWSFAYNNIETEFVTLAHQDDFYMPTYTESCLKTADSSKPIIIFTNYIEEFEGKFRESNLLLLVKRLMLMPFFIFKVSLRSSFMKKLLLSFGNPISCPTVMYNKKRIGKFDFNSALSMNLDWEANFRFAEMAGDFVYVNKKLIMRRIHKDSETTNALQTQKRHYEDQLLFEKVWPAYVVKILLKSYSIGYKSNE